MEDARPEIHVGDTGTAFFCEFLNEQDRPVNLTGAEALTLIFKSPEEAFEVNLTIVDAIEGTAQYLTAEEDLSIPGHWRVQGFAVLTPTQKYHTPVHRFTVHPNLEA